MTAASISRAHENLFPLVRQVNEDHSGTLWVPKMSSVPLTCTVREKRGVSGSPRLRDGSAT